MRAKKKSCNACGKRLAGAAFNSSARTADGLAATCRACTNARRRDRDQGRKGAARAESLASALRRADITAVRKLLPASTPPHWSSICELMRLIPLLRGVLKKGDRHRPIRELRKEDQRAPEPVPVLQQSAEKGERGEARGKAPRARHRPRQSQIPTPTPALPANGEGVNHPPFAGGSRGGNTFNRPTRNTVTSAETKSTGANSADGGGCGDVGAGGGPSSDPRLSLAELLLESGVERNVFTMAAMADVKGLARRLRRTPAEARLAARMEPASEQVIPLHVACASDWFSNGAERMSAQVQVAEMLYEHGADLNALARYRGIGAANPLFCACWTSRSAPLVRWLLDHGAHATEAHLLAALGHLQRHGSPAYNIAELLLAWGLPVDGGERWAGKGGQGTGTGDRGFANQGGITGTRARPPRHPQQLQSVPLPPYSRGGRGGRARRSGAEISTRPSSAAASESAVIPQRDNNSPPIASAREPDSPPRTPLQAFAHQANYRTVAWLIAHGAEVNARGPGGRTAAHFAAERNTGPATLALLVAHGADLSARDDDGHTPLALAKLNEKTRLVEWIARRIRAKKR